MTELAKAYGQRPVSLSEIASVERLPMPYLEQVMLLLRRAGLIEGVRGVHGGYRLARAPESIMVGEVVRVLDGPDATAPVECVGESYVEGACARESDCLSRPLWSRVKAAFDMILFTTSLADMCRADAGGHDLLNLSPEILSMKEHTVTTHG
jgi:Rrf2 family protein